jgi:tetratricopeptide (TPR) repeat protein
MKNNVVLCITLFLTILSLSHAQKDIPQLVEEIKPAVVTIVTYDSNGDTLSQGSGFFINSKGDFVTNYHVLSGASSAEAKTTGGNIYVIRNIIAENLDADIIMANLENVVHPIEYLNITANLPAQGERILIFGSPFGLELTVSDGIVSAVRNIPSFGNIIQITAPISSGSSGGPVVNLKGDVIGIVTFQMIEGQNLNFAIPGEMIVGLETNKKQTISEWTTNLEQEHYGSAKELYSTGLTYLWIEDYSKAIMYFEMAVEKDPNYCDAYFEIGYCYDEIGRSQDAIWAYKQAIRINPDYKLAYYNLGCLYGVQGLHENAILAFKEAIQIDSDFADAYSGLGWNYGQLGRYQDAIRYYKRAIRIDPDNDRTHFSLGLAYLIIEKYDKAIESYKQAIRINPDIADMHHSLGNAYAVFGRTADAVESYKQAIRINPDNANTHYCLGLTYVIRGDRGSALEEYKILKESNKDLANKLFNVIYE